MKRRNRNGPVPVCAMNGVGVEAVVEVMVRGGGVFQKGGGGKTEKMFGAVAMQWFFLAWLIIRSREGRIPFFGMRKLRSRLGNLRYGHAEKQTCPCLSSRLYHSESQKLGLYIRKNNIYWGNGLFFNLSYNRKNRQMCRMARNREERKTPFSEIVRRTRRSGRTKQSCVFYAEYARHADAESGGQGSVEEIGNSCGGGVLRLGGGSDRCAVVYFIAKRRDKDWRPAFRERSGGR